MSHEWVCARPLLEWGVCEGANERFVTQLGGEVFINVGRMSCG